MCTIALKSWQKCLMMNHSQSESLLMPGGGQQQFIHEPPKMLQVPLPFVDVGLPKVKPSERTLSVIGERFRVEFWAHSGYGIASGGKAWLIISVITAIVKMTGNNTVVFPSISSFAKTLGYRNLGGSKQGEYTQFKNALMSLVNTVVKVEDMKQPNKFIGKKIVDSTIGPFERVSLWESKLLGDTITFTLSQSFLDFNSLPVSYVTMRRLITASSAVQLYVFLVHQAWKATDKGRLVTWSKLAKYLDRFCQRHNSVNARRTVATYLPLIMAEYPLLKLEMRKTGILIYKSYGHITPKSCG